MMRAGRRCPDRGSPTSSPTWPWFDSPRPHKKFSDSLRRLPEPGRWRARVVVIRYRGQSIIETTPELCVY